MNTRVNSRHRCILHYIWTLNGHAAPMAPFWVFAANKYRTKHRVWFGGLDSSFWGEERHYQLRPMVSSDMIHDEHEQC